MVIALRTPESGKASWTTLRDQLAGICRATAIELEGGKKPEDVRADMERVADAIPSRADITVDLTHALPHLSILTLMAVQYISSLKEVSVRGVWYGLPDGGGTVPFLDLHKLLEVPRWLHALQVMNHTGDSRPIAEILGCGPSSGSARDIVRDLERVSKAYLSGLPLELGLQASAVRRTHRRRLRKLISGEYEMPLGGELADRIHHSLSGFEFDSSPIYRQGWKRNIPLDRRELGRQVLHVDNLLERGHVATALGLMREWTVSWVLLMNGRTAGWLDRQVRHEATNLLNAIEAVGRDRELARNLSEEQRCLGTYWGKLRDLRNGYAHHGMRGADMVRCNQHISEIGKIQDYWNKTLSPCPCINLKLGEKPGRRVLVSPIGKLPGVLYSALNVLGGGVKKFDFCLVICSETTKPGIQDAFDAARYKGESEALMLENPYGGISDMERKARAMREHFVGAGEVLVNLTGGTTLMGFAAGQLATEADKLASPVRRFGLLDERPRATQKDEPWQIGEPFWIDQGKDGDFD